MQKTSAAATPLRQELERLAAFEPTEFPLLSLYLNLGANERGRDSYDTFVRKALSERAKAFASNTPGRMSFDRDAGRIQTYLADSLDRSANGVAIFACAGAHDFFEAVQLDAKLDDHWLFIGPVPHLYPLAKLIDQYPRYAAVLLDTNKARILVFGLASLQRTTEVTGEKTRRGSFGGWSQMRYQRHVDNTHLHNIKEVIDTLDRIVKAEQIHQIVVAGDEVAVPIFREQLAPPLREKVIDVIRLDRHAGEAEILEATLAAVRNKDAETDVERVEQLIDGWRSGGLAVAGPEATLAALQLGQVDELLITGAADRLKPVQRLPDGARLNGISFETSAARSVDQARLTLSDELVKRAEQTGARIRFIEDRALLAPVGGVGALLRFRL